MCLLRMHVCVCVCVCAHVSMCVVALLNVRRLGSVELQANELLHALPVLHLGGAVGGVLTCGTVALRLSHLLVHLGQPQPVGEGGGGGGAQCRSR